MSRIIGTNNPYQIKMEDKLKDLVVYTKPIRKEPLYIPNKKGVETK